MLYAHFCTELHSPSKLRFTADGKTVVGEDTTLAYYMGLKGEVVDDASSSPNEKEKEVRSDDAADTTPSDGKEKDSSPSTSSGKIKTFQVDLISNKAGGTGAIKKNPTVDPAKIQENVDKIMDSMKTDGGVKVGDLTRLSESLGALKADSMNFAGETSKIVYPEPLDLTELQWDVVFRNNRALHGWYHNGDLLVKARKRAFQLKPAPNQAQAQAQARKEPNTDKDGKTEIEGKGKETTPLKTDPIPSAPPFYVWDDATVQVTEMKSALEKTMASQGFSSTVIKASAGGGVMGTEATASLAIEKEHSNANKELKASQVSELNVSYKFPRAAVELDTYCLELTEEAKRDALACRNRADVGRWQRDYGSVFATQFTLGGELVSSRLFSGTDEGRLSALKDSTKIAAGASLTTPYGSASASYGSTNSTESQEGERSTQQSLRLAWEARGGNTLLCSNPPAWTSTVKDHRLWRIMDQQGIVRMIDFVKSVHPKAGSFLQSPEFSTDRESDPSKAASQAFNLLNSALESKERNPTVDKLKAFYESANFVIGEFNDSLAKDQKPLELKMKTAWAKLTFEQKITIGMFAWDKKVINFD
ncbi:hypothetical protein GGS20DRAFT_529396 [Poronia punctata]|nr:hypothetical protein GGS20DRAFT_529396 [Poronia punctata]